MDVELKVTFSTSSNLTEESSVDVHGRPDTADLGEWGYPSGTFETAWPSDEFECGGTVNKTEVAKLEYDEEWFYRCPDGSDNWISAGNIADRIMYLTRTTPHTVATSEPIACYELSTQYCAGVVATDTDDKVCDDVMTGFSGDYVYDAGSGNCAFMSSDYTHLVALQGVSVSQVKWSVGAGGLTHGMAVTERTHNITTLGNAAQVFDWGFHWWVEAAGTRDPSAGTSPAGAWGDYEDALFADYERYNIGPPASYFWNGSNPANQTTETGGTWKMVHSNPAVAHSFIGPATPWP